ncbi:hypothetical protein [Mycobacteroides abscessus]|uniref:hypothetical protein n=1 Tax=Mycobacteroides abscessus TaxID=36809 RepID=UPI000C2596D9|nr:hypothetical protein [Mycobacteroides abscessus]
MNTPELVTALTDQLGLKLVAYLVRARESRVVRQWAQGTLVLANAQDIERLRLTLQAASLITARESAAIAQAWFQGLNPDLGDISPARLLRENDIDIAGPAVLAAARQFANSQ